jgi:hypothetical protein
MPALSTGASLLAAGASLLVEGVLLADGSSLLAALAVGDGAVVVALGVAATGSGTSLATGEAGACVGIATVAWTLGELLERCNRT